MCLERRTGGGGRDVVDHPPGGFDDLADSVAGVIVKAAGASTGDDVSKIGLVTNFKGTVFKPEAVAMPEKVKL